MKRLESNLTKCECVYSEKLEKLIPLFELIPIEDEEEDELFSNSPLIDKFISEYKYPETGETFDCTCNVYEGIYDLIKKEVYQYTTIKICDSWMTKENLIGKKVISEKRISKEDPIEYVRLSKIVDLIFETNPKTYSRGYYYVNFIKISELESFLADNQKMIIWKEKDLGEIKEDTLIRLVEPYVRGILEDGSEIIMRHAKILKEE